MAAGSLHVVFYAYTMDCEWMDHELLQHFELIQRKALYKYLSLLLLHGDIFVLDFNVFRRNLHLKKTKSTFPHKQIHRRLFY